MVHTLHFNSHQRFNLQSIHSSAQTFSTLSIKASVDLVVSATEAISAGLSSATVANRIIPGASQRVQICHYLNDLGIRTIRKKTHSGQNGMINSTQRFLQNNWLQEQDGNERDKLVRFLHPLGHCWFPNCRLFLPDAKPVCFCNSTSFEQKHHVSLMHSQAFEVGFPLSRAKVVPNFLFCLQRSQEE